MHASEKIENEPLLSTDSITNRVTNDLTNPTQLLDHRTVDWKRLARARYWMEQSFEYTYPGPIYDLNQRLIVIPPDHFGDQQLIGYELRPSSPLATTTTEIDSFGNRIIRIFVPKVDERVTFDMKMVIERDFAPYATPLIPTEETLRYRQPTFLTEANAQIEAHAKHFLTQYPEPENFADALNTWIYQTMRYGRGATTVHTTAAEVLQIGQGLCQDYAHIMLAICRAAGLCARYVSGHLLGEGRSHAWVELLLPTEKANDEKANGDEGYRTIAFDPTNHRRTTPAYLTIAVGRDYSDVSPTSGTFSAPYPGQLHTTKRAGITEIELRQNIE